MQIEATAELRRANISSFQSGSVSLSDPYSFSTPSLSISVSPSPSPSPGRPGLLCPSSSFYFMPRPSLAPSSSITSRTLARRPSPPTSRRRCRFPLPSPARYRCSLHWAPVMTHSAVTQHFIRLHLAFITPQHRHPTETHQKNTDFNQPHFIS